jgi:hypothetical protein
MAIAQIAEGEDFKRQWLTVRNTEALKNLILLSTRKKEIRLRDDKLKA